MRRYSPEQVVLLAFHDGREPTACIADSTWNRNYSWYSSPWGSSSLGFGREKLGPVIGKRSIVTASGDTLKGALTVDGRRTPGDVHGTEGQAFENVHRIDSLLMLPPEAFVDLTVERVEDSIRVAVAVDSLVGTGRRLALRLVLVEDTVMIKGGTIRRMQINVVRASLHGEGYPLGVVIPGDQPSLTSHAFDLKQLQALQDSMWADPVWVARFSTSPEDLNEEYLQRIRAEKVVFPDHRDWTIDPKRLFVVAFVQDLDTGDVLQGAMVKVPETGTANVKR